MLVLQSLNAFVGVASIINPDSEVPINILIDAPTKMSSHFSAVSGL